MQRHGRRGVLVYRLDNNDDNYMNARHMCTLFHEVRTDQLSLKPCSHVSSAYDPALCQISMGCMATSNSVQTSMFPFSRTGRQRSNKNGNADITCEWTLISRSVYYVTKAIYNCR